MVECGGWQLKWTFRVQPEKLARRIRSATNDEAPWQHLSLRHRLISWVSRNFFDHYQYTVRRGLLKGMKRRGGLAWLPSLTDRGSPEERFWRSHDLTDKVVYDIGAFEGLLTLFFARQAARVISYEPNPRNYGRLMENLRLNGLENVTVRNVGVGDVPRELPMGWDPARPGFASFDAESVATPMTTESLRVTTLDADRADHRLPPPDLIKIDIEGFELRALTGARETLAVHKPAIYLEMHGETLREKRERVASIVEFLQSVGYSNIQHVETGQSITPANSAVACQGHLFARFG